MAKTQTLTPEDPEARAPFVPVRDSQVYVGDRIRIRDLVPTNIKENVIAGNQRRKVFKRNERVIVADVSRVMMGADGRVYLLGQIVEATTMPASGRIRHMVGSSAMMAKTTITKELFRHRDHGPSPAERSTESPVEHSKRVRTEAFWSLFSDAAAATSRDHVWDRLEVAGNTLAQTVHAKSNERRVIAGEDPLPAIGVGQTEMDQLTAVEKDGAEPEWWMLPVLTEMLSGERVAA